MGDINLRGKISVWESMYCIVRFIIHRAFLHSTNTENNVIVSLRNEACNLSAELDLYRAFTANTGPTCLWSSQTDDSDFISLSIIVSKQGVHMSMRVQPIDSQLRP